MSWKPASETQANHESVTKKSRNGTLDQSCCCEQFVQGIRSKGQAIAKRDLETARTRMRDWQQRHEENEL